MTVHNITVCAIFNASLPMQLIFRYNRKNNTRYNIFNYNFCITCFFSNCCAILPPLGIFHSSTLFSFMKACISLAFSSGGHARQFLSLCQIPFFPCRGKRNRTASSLLPCPVLIGILSELFEPLSRTFRSLGLVPLSPPTIVPPGCVADNCCQITLHAFSSF